MDSYWGGSPNLIPSPGGCFLGQGRFTVNSATTCLDSAVPIFGQSTDTYVNCGSPIAKWYYQSTIS
jgi:hypothetical protein